jgi:EAL domain-containing protein (putative c-di-GMP-specific phosphodiesterase class I)
VVAEPPVELAESAILVVDDQEANLTLLARILEAAGFTNVRGMTDARAALAAFRDIDPALVLLDLHMPGVDGFEFIAAARRMVPVDAFLPILVLTADISAEAKERALSAGAKDFLTKPFDRTEVVLRVRNLLETRVLHERLRAHNLRLERQVREQAERERRLAAERRIRRERIEGVLGAGLLRVVFQPIVELATGRVIGAEALARFACEPDRPPDAWFTEAAEVGLGPDLEVAAVREALAQLDGLPAGAYMSLNASPATLFAGRLEEVLAGVPCERLVIELTEHHEVSDYERLNRALAPLREAGVRLAVDDTGAGFASLRHILRLGPDVIKLDRTLTQGIDTDVVRRSLALALVRFAGEAGALLTAEGVETPGELAVLSELGVQAAQGYHLAPPAPPPVPAEVSPVRPGASRRR